MLITIAAKNVRPNDRIYNSSALHPSCAWVRVTSTEMHCGHIVIKTNVYDTWKHPLEAIAVQRDL